MSVTRRKMKCHKRDCDGFLAKEAGVRIPIGCHKGEFFPCTKCGRIHDYKGRLVNGADDKELYLINGKVAKISRSGLVTYTT